MRSSWLATWLSTYVICLHTLRSWLRPILCSFFKFYSSLPFRLSSFYKQNLLRCFYLCDLTYRKYIIKLSKLALFVSFDIWQRLIARNNATQKANKKPLSLTDHTDLHRKKHFWKPSYRINTTVPLKNCLSPKRLSTLKVYMYTPSCTGWPRQVPSHALLSVVWKMSSPQRL